MKIQFIVVIVVLSFLAACPPPREIAEGEGEGEGEASECLTATLGPVTFNFQDDVSTHYQAEVLSPFDGVSPDFLVLQFFNYNERIGDLGAGTFPLDDDTNDNYGHCAECVLFFADQIAGNTAPNRVFFQSGGSITVEKNPREGIDLIGRIDDLVLVESTIGGEALESAPVPGGDCLELGDVELAIDFTPQGWTCDPAAFDAGDGVCDCGCGIPDDDCFVDVNGEIASTTGCGVDQVCGFDALCKDTCDIFGGDACPNAAEVCSFGFPSDTCAGANEIDDAQLGAQCEGDFALYCAIDNTIPFGLCEFDLDEDGTRICRARCLTDEDCQGNNETCFTVVGSTEDGSARGYCTPS